MNRKLYHPEGDAGAAAPPAAAAIDAAPAPAPSQSSSTVLSEKEISDLLSFNPFDSTESPPAEAKSEAAPPAKPPETLPTPAPIVPISDSEAIKKELAETKALLQSLQQPPKPPEAVKPSEGPKLPDYNFTVPPQLMQLLDSEDPVQRSQGIGAVMTGTARAVHQTLMTQVGEYLSQMVDAVPQLVQQQIAQAQSSREVFDDFYGTYKDLNVPELRPMLQAITQQVMQERGIKTWGPTLKLAIAERAYQVLGRTLPGASAPPPQFNGSGSPTRSAVPSQPGFLEQVGF